MRIQFDRTGGFAGLRMAATLETESLPPDEAQSLLDLVKAARFFDLPAVIEPPPAGADQFKYKLTIEAEGRRHTVEMGDASAPETLQPLLRRLTVLARSPRQS